MNRSKTSMPKPKPVRMPLLDDKLVQDTRAKTTSNALKRGGGNSTMLSNMIRGLTGSVGYLGR